ncbi:ParB N-terminal domain-containing protein [Candidatus Gottesmanbacteria bacterium]|nr:ParB N-terminal domain-containing protein [Candidatus Gottesmanbacteria bacterium]
MDSKNIVVSCRNGCARQLSTTMEAIHRALHGRDPLLKLFKRLLLELSPSDASKDAHEFYLIKHANHHLTPSDMKILPDLTAIDRPRLVHHDPEKNRIYIINPFREDQPWGMVRAPTKQTNTPTLTATTEEYGLVAIHRLVPYLSPNGQSRKHGSVGFNSGSIERLSRGLKHQGQAVEIIVRRLSAKERLQHDGDFELISGERRMWAAKAIGLTSLRARILPAETPRKNSS